MATKTKAQARKIRHYRVRKHVQGTADRPRVNVFKSNQHFYAQIIDDATKTTLVSSSTQQLKINGNNIDNAKQVAKDLASKANKAKITSVVFDRGGYIYHGKVKAFADTLRENGLKF